MGPEQGIQGAEGAARVPWLSPPPLPTARFWFLEVDIKLPDRRVYLASVRKRHSLDVGVEEAKKLIQGFCGSLDFPPLSFPVWSGMR